MTSPNFQSWLASFGSCFSGPSSVWKHHLDLLYVIRHEVIGYFRLFFSHLLLVDFSTNFYSLFCQPWICSYRCFSIYTDPVHPILQTMCIHLSHSLPLKHTSPTKPSLHLQDRSNHRQHLLAFLCHHHQVPHVIPSYQWLHVRQLIQRL